MPTVRKMLIRTAAVLVLTVQLFILLVCSAEYNLLLDPYRQKERNAAADAFFKDRSPENRARLRRESAALADRHALKWMGVTAGFVAVDVGAYLWFRKRRKKETMMV